MIKYSEEVINAQRANKPVVALESTIISHGMPYPQNLETARNLENIVREKGCCPATIFIHKGKICIGAESSELEYLAKAKDVKKVSTREIAEVLAEKSTGATTVAATMRCAAMAGVRVFATGGIGGVHRQAEESFDISADLTELARTPVIVISAGAKAILDIPKTLEYLETQSVPVFGWKTSSFPGFYSSETPWEVKSIESVKAIANIFMIQGEIGIESGILLANPISKDFEIPWDEMAKTINSSLEDMKKEKINGKKVTPYLLKRITELTGGESLKTNIELVKSNVCLAAEIAIALKKASKNE